MKLIYIIIDGMGDRTIPELGDKTPLEYANTPNMDFLAKSGKTGIMYTVGKGIAPESDVAVVSILGYDPFKYHVSRGALEAIGAGLNMETGDLALRCNFATLTSGNQIIDRRAGRDLTLQEAEQLAQAVNDQLNFESYSATATLKATAVYRAALVIKSQRSDLSGNIDNTDPAYKRVDGIGVADLDAKMILKKCTPFDETKQAKISAKLVNEFTKKSRIILEDHEVNKTREKNGKLKANGILCRDAGSKVPNFPFLCDRFDLSYICLADMNVERGISRLAGMSLVDLPLPSKDLKYDCKLRLKKLFKVFPDYDCFYVHIKGPDIPGHDGNFELKSDMISIIDEYFVGVILEKISLEDTIICITADHATPCSLKAHSDDPVPILISGNNLRADMIQSFSENECAKGEIGALTNGTELMPLLVKFVKKIEKS